MCRQAYRHLLREMSIDVNLTWYLLVAHVHLQHPTNYLVQKYCNEMSNKANASIYFQQLINKSCATCQCAWDQTGGRTTYLNMSRVYRVSHFDLLRLRIKRMNNQISFFFIIFLFEGWKKTVRNKQSETHSDIIHKKIGQIPTFHRYIAKELNY